jgi:prepilin-type N-terminal cleavage/methylation domain-containing protein
MTKTTRFVRPTGFSLVELMTVLAIITILVTITIPVVSRVRRSAQQASVAAQISSLDAAINAYYQDFTAYPGPLPRKMLFGGDPTQTPSPAQWVYYPPGTSLLVLTTGPENLALGLLGGLKPAVSGPGYDFDPALVGPGPRSLNSNNPKSFKSYIDGMPLSSGKYSDGAGTAGDSAIPEIVDRFPNAMPILYLRATVGAGGVISIAGNDAQNSPVMAGGAPTQYELSEVLSYTKPAYGPGSTGSIGEGKSIRASAYTTPPSPGMFPHGLQTVDRNKTMDKGAGANYSYPYDAFPYFKNSAIPPTDVASPNATGTPRNKDRYILISAGVDRVYGTADDITNFGSVTE